MLQNRVICCSPSDKWRQKQASLAPLKACVSDVSTVSAGRELHQPQREYVLSSQHCHTQLSPQRPVASE